METSEAMETQRDTGRAGTLIANNDGLFEALAGEFTRHVSEDLYLRPVYLASSERIINIVHNKIKP